MKSHTPELLKDEGLSTPITFVIFIIGIWFFLKASLLPRFIDDDVDIIFFSESLVTAKQWAVGYIHGPLSFYFIKLSRFIFGISPFGGRMINLLFSIFNAYFFYKLIYIARGKIAACLGAAVFFFNAYFIFYSAYVCEEVFLFFFAILSTLFFYRFVMTEQKKYFFLTGFFVGLGLLVKLKILLLMPGFICMMLAQERKTLKIQDIIFAVLIMIILASPYLYSLSLFPFFNSLYGKNLISFLKPSMNFLYLFVPLPFLRGVEDVSLSHDLGYNSIGYWLGIACLISTILGWDNKKDKFLRLMYILLISMVVTHLFLAGQYVEPRHFSLLFIPALAILSVWLSNIFIKYKSVRLYVVIFIIILFLQAAMYSHHFGRFAALHSKVTLDSWEMPDIEVDLNDLSRAFSNVAREYNPSLVVFPAHYLDSVGHFVTAYTGMKTLSPLMVDRYIWRYFTSEDIKNIIVFLTPSDDFYPFFLWASQNGYKISFDERNIIIKEQDLSLPINLLQLTKNTDKKISNIGTIIDFDDKWDPSE